MKVLLMLYSRPFNAELGRGQEQNAKQQCAGSECSDTYCRQGNTMNVVPLTTTVCNIGAAISLGLQILT